MSRTHFETVAVSGTFDSSESTKEAVFQRVVDFLKKHNAYSGESIMQSDDPVCEAPVLLSEIADDLLGFEIHYK